MKVSKKNMVYNNHLGNICVMLMSQIYQRLNDKMQVYQEEARRVSEEMVEIAIRRQ